MQHIDTDLIESDIETSGFCSESLSGNLTFAAVEDERSSGFFESFDLPGYGRLWFGYLIGALIIAAICNGVWGVKLANVVDVNLALFLTWIGFLAFLTAVGGIFGLLEGDIRSFFVNAVFFVLLGFLPMGAVTGYSIYGWLGGGTLGGASFVYDIYMNIFVSGYQVLASAGGDFLGVIEKTTDTAGVVTTAVNTDSLMKWTQIGAGSVAILDFVWRRLGGSGTSTYA